MNSAWNIGKKKIKVISFATGILNEMEAKQSFVPERKNI